MANEPDQSNTWLMVGGLLILLALIEWVIAPMLEWMMFPYGYFGR